MSIAFASRMFASLATIASAMARSAAFFRSVEAIASGRAAARASRPMRAMSFVMSCADVSDFVSIQPSVRSATVRATTRSSRCTIAERGS